MADLRVNPSRTQSLRTSATKPLDPATLADQAALARLADTWQSNPALGALPRQDTLAAVVQRAMAAQPAVSIEEQCDPPSDDRTPRPSTQLGDKPVKHSWEAIPPQEAGAWRQLKEDPALEHLTPAQQAEFKQLAKALGNSPRAREALTKLLLSGKLTDQDLAGGKILLDNLVKLLADPKAAGIDAKTLLAQTLIEIADPATINQQDRGTCAATSVQIHLALTHPSEYVRLVAGLSSPEGKVKLANGDTLSRVSDWAAADGGRSLPSKLLQPAFMTYAIGRNGTYSNTTDKETKTVTGPSLIPFLTTTYTIKTHGGGLSDREVTRLESGVFDQKEHTVNTGNTVNYVDPKKYTDMNAAFAELQKAVARGPVTVGIDWPGLKNAGHEIVVTAIKNGKVHFINPWGKVQSMDAAEFKILMLGYSVPAASGSGK